MVLMLELASISIFSACVSAFFCMITNGTCKVPKLISLKYGWLRPQLFNNFSWSNRNTKVCKILANQELDAYYPINNKKCCNFHMHNEHSAYDRKITPQDQSVVIRNKNGDALKIYKKKSWPRYKPKINDTEKIKHQKTALDYAINNLKNYLQYTEPVRYLEFCKSPYWEKLRTETCANAKQIARNCKFCGKLENVTVNSCIRDRLSKSKLNFGDEREIQRYIECKKAIHKKKWRIKLARALNIPRKYNYDSLNVPVKSPSSNFIVIPVEKQLYFNRNSCYLDALRNRKNKTDRKK
ncbi:uncharacterized protein LOC112493719 [Cephus cinctus]|uniref:Uncharacterized protein LOC112493719 n=1 Tax=Cephus cinctus TaxID=211228 RepID=A0AAJ7R8L5_CEPCN|nr:uncharacterized protein LOC112493719 [Cephus cinctus]